MQKKQTLVKKIFLCFIAVIMCLSPVFLAGCNPVPDNSSSSGDSGSSGGDSSPPDINEDPSEAPSDDPWSTEIEGANFLSNYKISYRPNDDDNINSFILDVKKQTNEVAFDIMRTLYAEYGMGIYESRLENANEINVVQIYINKQGKYEKTTNLVSKDSILKQTSPLFSQNISSLGYDIKAHYAKYFTHENAINEDYDLSNNLLEWNWNCKNYNSSDNPATKLEKTFNDFVNNLVYRKKLELALLLITCGYDITPTGGNYSAYTAGAELIETLRTQYADDVEFYEAVDNNLFNQYYKLIDHSGYTANEVSYIASFIQNEVIGTEIVAVDNTKYLNIVVYKGGSDNKIYSLDRFSTSSWYSKYNKFLTEETFVSIYFEGDNSDIENRKFYSNNGPNDINLDDLSQEELEKLQSEKTDINNLTDYTQQAYLPAQHWTNPQQNKLTIPTEIFDNDGNILSGMESLIFNNFIDTDGDGVFTADFWDIDGDGNTNYVLSEKEGNVTIFIFSARKQYFKNYSNTAYKIARDITQAVANEDYKDFYQKQYGEKFDFDVRYPIIPASFFADYTNDDILLNENGIMNMPTGYKRYQNMIVMPKKTFNFEEFYMFITRQLDSTGVTQDFELKIYIRYYDAASNSFATWDQNGEESQFYDCGSVTVVAASDLSDIGEPFEIKSKQILSSAKINGTQKGNAKLYAFSNLPAGNASSPTIITKHSEAAKMYSFIELPNGQKTITYNPSYLSEGERTSYMELLFATDVSNNFQFAIMPTEANA